MIRKTIFISCGQFTDAERRLGKRIAEMVRELTDLEPFFAEEVQDLNGLDANILNGLHDCAAFITVFTAVDLWVDRAKHDPIAGVPQTWGTPSNFWKHVREWWQ